MGRFDEADELIRECEDLSASDDVVDVGLAATGRARILSVRGNGPAAVEQARRAVATFEPTQLPMEHGDALLALSDANLLTGDRGGRKAATEALDLYERKGALVYVERARRALERTEDSS